MIKNNKFRGLAAAAAVAALFTAQPAAAATVTIDGWWGGAAAVGIVNTGTGGSVNENVYAGGFNTFINGNSIQSFCVDIFNSFEFIATSTSTPSSQTSLVSAQAAEDLGRLYTNHHNEIAAHGNNSVNEAAFQLAVWEIVNEQAPDLTYDLGGGTFLANGLTNWANSVASVSLAQTWLTELSFTSPSAYNATIWTVQSMSTDTGWAQDVVTFTSVPEPETYAMMLVGLGLLGFSARRKSQF
ncbi:MAG: PEP-CTERM sorting domain-containing protein [Sideroxyarcus sp.]|nr:PEP-CTERM sorting domain-containing protein [Sideroxyarcus sp.]